MNAPSRIFGRGPFRIWSAIRSAASWRNTSSQRLWVVTREPVPHGEVLIFFRLTEGIKIEVKTSAYIQSWEQKKFSRIEFSIAESLYWDGVAYAKEKKRQADVYVFCVLKHKEQDTINPLDLEQWDFYPVSTAILNETVKGQKTICLARVAELCGRGPCTYQMLRKVVVEVWQGGAHGARHARAHKG